MFLKQSRYANTATISTTDSSGRPVQALKLRILPNTVGAVSIVDSGMQLDVMSKRQYKDGSRFWHIADANTELEANGLVQIAGELIRIPGS